MTQKLSLTVNGTAYEVEVEPRRTLADAIRDDCGLTGTHLGCEHGVCGACTIMVDGAAVRSCLMLAVQAHGKDVLTVEGLGDPDDLHPLQQALRERHAFQCGFCTPGFVMTSLALLQENPSPDEAEIREVLSGNVCRCTGYQSIVEGVLLAAERGAGQADVRRSTGPRG